MSHENPGKTIHWRDRLESLDYLPGKALNKDAAWDKLYGRLRGEHRHKKLAWYWIAAACSAVVLMIALVMNRNTSKRDVTNVRPAVTKQTQKIDKSILPGDKKNETRNDVAVAMPKKESVSTSHKSVEPKRRVRVIDVAHSVVPANTVNSTLENPAVIQPLQIANNNSTVVQAPPAKKKLGVVHINELGDPVIEVPDVVHNLDKHKLKFGSGEVYANSPTGYKTNDYNVLTAKL